MTRRRLAVLSIAAAMLWGCTSTPDTDGPAASGRSETIAGVTVTVPDSWRDQEVPTPDGVAGMAVFSPGGGRLDTLQVIVGCGEADADDIVIARVAEPREGLIATDAEDAVPVEVEGLDTTRRTVITFGAGRDDDANTLRVAGLYGATDGVLVLVEYGASFASFDRSAALAVLDSVAVDADAAAQSCP